MDCYRETMVAFVDAACEATRMNRTQLARAVGVAPSTMTRVKPDNDTVISLRVAWKISALSGVPVPQPPPSDPEIAKGLDAFFEVTVLRSRAERAWLLFWRRLLPEERVFMLRTHRIDPPKENGLKQPAE